MESVKDTFDSVVETVKDRMGNPLLGAFVLSWLIWNFRLVLVLIGDGEGGWLGKLNYIDNRLMTSNVDWIVHCLVVPLIIACLWVFVFPFVSRKIMVFHKEQLQLTNEAVLKVEHTAMLPEPEATRLRMRHRSAATQWEQDRKAFLLAIEELQDRLDQRSDEPQQLAANNASEQEKTIEGPPAIDSGKAHPPTEIAQDFSDEGKMPGARFGLKFAETNTLPNVGSTYVRFEGRSLIWPWRVVASGDLDLPGTLTAKLNGAVLSEEALLTLFAMRNREFASPAAISNITNIEKFQSQVALDELKSLGLVKEYNDGDFSVIADGRMFLSWLLRKGFKFLKHTARLRPPKDSTEDGE